MPLVCPYRMRRSRPGRTFPQPHGAVEATAGDKLSIATGSDAPNPTVVPLQDSPAGAHWQCPTASRCRRSCHWRICKGTTVDSERRYQWRWTAYRQRWLRRRRAAVEGSTGRLLRILYGHTSGIRSVAVSGDGQVVASGSFDGTAKLWDASSGRLFTTLPGHIGGVWAVALSHDGHLVASGGYDGGVKLWEAESGRLLSTLEGPHWRYSRRGPEQRRAAGGERQRGYDRPGLGRRRLGGWWRSARGILADLGRGAERRRATRRELQATTARFGSGRRKVGGC